MRVTVAELELFKRAAVAERMTLSWWARGVMRAAAMEQEGLGAREKEKEAVDV